MPSAGDVLAFFLTLMVAYLVSAVLRFLLQEEIYRRAGVATGVSYAAGMSFPFPRREVRVLADRPANHATLAAVEGTLGDAGRRSEGAPGPAISPILPPIGLERPAGPLSPYGTWGRQEPGTASGNQPTPTRGTK